jgi:hypothetical protein
VSGTMSSKRARPADDQGSKSTKEEAPAAEPAAVGAEAEALLDPTEAIATLVELKGHHAALSEIARGAFRSLATDADRAKLGAETRAVGVLGDAVRWALQIDADLRGHPGLTDHYAVPRFVYFLECVLALAQQLRAERDGVAKRASKRAGASSAREEAISERRKLVRALESFAGRRADERAEIESTVGRTGTDDELAESLRALGALAGRWLSRSDDASKVLAASAGLSQAKVTAAAAARRRLVGAGKEAALAGPARGHDSPEVNLREGGVLVEMEEALAALEHAHDEDPTVRRLTPGPATRRVLENRPKRPAAEAPAPAKAAPAPVQG